MNFSDLRLDESILRAVRAEGYETPTPIQAEAIPVIAAGRDVLGCAQTGTGKTAAFALPILQRLLKHTTKSDANQETAPPQKKTNRRGARKGGRNGRRKTEVVPFRPIRTLVLSPTRELAEQIFESFETYGANTGVRATAIFGGVRQNRQVRALRDGVDVVIATPGRLRDLMSQGLLKLDTVEILVLDEADRMLDMGFLPDIHKILAETPRDRQSLLFSATMPKPIRKLADDILQKPVSIEVARVSAPAARIDHHVYHVEHKKKDQLLIDMLQREPGQRSLVFTRTKYGADRLTRILTRENIAAVALHGNKSQNARRRALESFRVGDTPVLVATDVAARGLDVEDISFVFNFDLTHEPETYIHRIGRTGRAGAAGVAISFCTREQRADLRAIEKLLNAPLKNMTPGIADEPKSDRRSSSKPKPNRRASADSKPRRTKKTASKNRAKTKRKRNTNHPNEQHPTSRRRRPRRQRTRV